MVTPGLAPVFPDGPSLARHGEVGQCGVGFPWAHLPCNVVFMMAAVIVRPERWGSWDKTEDAEEIPVSGTP